MNSTVCEDMSSLVVASIDTELPLDYSACLKLAERAHEHQKRKDGTTYINHCTRVAVVAEAMLRLDGPNNYLAKFAACAGVLHDTIEDQAVDFEDIEGVAGYGVAAAVALLSDDKRLQSEKRHFDFCRQLNQSPVIVQFVKLADIADNAKSAFAMTSTKRSFVSDWSNKSRQILGSMVKLTVNDVASITSRFFNQVDSDLKSLIEATSD